MSLVDYTTAARRRTSNWRTRRVQPGLLLAWAVLGDVTHGGFGFVGVDSLDPLVAPSTGTRVRGGLTYREACLICEEVLAALAVCFFFGVALTRGARARVSRACRSAKLDCSSAWTWSR